MIEDTTVQVDDFVQQVALQTIKPGETFRLTIVGPLYLRVASKPIDPEFAPHPSRGYFVDLESGMLNFVDLTTTVYRHEYRAVPV